MKEYLVLLFDDNCDICSSFQTRAMYMDSVRWSNIVFDMISYTKSTIESLLVVCLDDGKYRRYKI